jgi:CheY-like chemotaxis protein
MQQGRLIEILMAEDDPDDQMLVRHAFEDARLLNKLTVVNNGEELLSYLRREPPYEDTVRPGLILLDLNMPRMDGREALREMKQDPLLRSIPVVVLTTSSAEDDVSSSYDLGVSTYIRKPVTFEKLVEVIQGIGRYWFEIAELPENSFG